MARTMRALGIVVAAWALALPSLAQALCTCGDRPEGCSSAAACLGGKIPSDDCSPPRGGTCKIKLGTGIDLVCCCGCTKGAGPLSCAFGGTAAAIKDTLPAAATSKLCSASTKAAKPCDKAATSASNQLNKAVANCDKGKAITRQVNGAKKALTGLDTKLERLGAKNKVTPECAAALKGLIGTYVSEIDDIATTGGSGGGSVPTTTTTLPPNAPSCSGGLSTVPLYSNELNYTFSCNTKGLTLGTFGMLLTDTRTFTNWIDAAGFTCQVQQWSRPNDYLWCVGGPIGDGQPITGRLQFNPAPSGQQTVQLYVRDMSMQYGPYDLTGP